MTVTITTTSGKDIRISNVLRLETIYDVESNIMERIVIFNPHGGIRGVFFLQNIAGYRIVDADGAAT